MTMYRQRMADSFLRIDSRCRSNANTKEQTYIEAYFQGTVSKQFLQQSPSLINISDRDPRAVQIPVEEHSWSLSG